MGAAQHAKRGKRVIHEIIIITCHLLMHKGERGPHINKLRTMNETLQATMHHMTIKTNLQRIWAEAVMLKWAVNIKNQSINLPTQQLMVSALNTSNEQYRLQK